MNYINNSLLSDEKIIYWTKPHWIIFFPTMVALLITIIFYLFGPQFGLNVNLFSNLQAYQLIAWFALIVTIIFFIRAWVTFKTSEYGITNKRVIMKVGLIQRFSLEIFLDKIEAVGVDQTIPGRLLNYGTITIIGTGGTRDPFSNVPNPLGFRKLVQQEIDLFKSK